MKFKNKKQNLDFRIATAMLILSFSVLAVTGDTQQPIQIVSDTQSIDIQDNIIQFTGNVMITQGSIKIHASKLVVTRPDGMQGTEIIDGYGTPVTFYQMQDNGNPVKGHALHIHYELPKDLVILTGDAYLEQVESNITSDKITFLIKEKKMQAYSNKGGHVTTVLIPFQVQDKKDH